MYAFLHRQHVSYSELFRWCGRAGGLALVLAWIAFAITENARSDSESPTTIAFYQAAALAIVFTGYAVGWRKEFAGGVLAVLGTVAFFVVHEMTFNIWPEPGAAWFAAPGVLYLLAWKSDKRGV